MALNVTRIIKSKMDIARIVEDMTSRDVDRIRKAGAEIIENSQRKDQIRKLFPYRDDIFKSTRYLDLGGRVASNNRFYNFPIEIIDFHAALNGHDRCTCELYLKSYQDFDPNVEVNNGSMTLFAKGIGDYTFVYGMKCRKCNRRFHASERHYHYVWYKWDILTKEVSVPRTSTEIDLIFKLYLDIIYTSLAEDSQRSDLKFHKENLTYYRKRLMEDETTKDYEARYGWTPMLNKAINDIELVINKKH